MKAATFPGLTIDGVHSKDLDDAVWVERIERGWRVIVSIALVADAVVIGSELDDSARAIGFTRYSGTSTTQPMLPRGLSEESLSLLPGDDREVVAFVVDLDERLTVSSIELKRVFLQNKGRLSHEEAGSRLETDKGEIGRMLSDAWTLASGLLENRRQSGAIAYFSAASGVATDEEGNIVILGSSSAVSRGYLIVQELMILANQAVSEKLAREGIPFLYRNHRGSPVADRKALTEDLEIASQSGPMQAAASSRLGMMLGRATLGPTAMGHFGLNLPVYARVTSPIRRYEDLVNQRILISIADQKTVPYSPEDLAGIAEALNTLSEAVAAKRTDAFREASQRRAERLQDADRYQHLDQSTMTAVLKSAAEKGSFSESLVAEIRQRLSKGSLTSKDEARLLFAPESDGQRVARVMLDHLEENAHRAVSIIDFLRLDRQVVVSSWREEEISQGFKVTASCVFAGKDFEVSQEAQNKKTAKQRAAVGILAAMTGVEWTPPGSWQNSKSLPDPGAEANSKGVLLELCRARGWPTPAFNMTTLDAPSHAPIFTCEASVSISGKIYRSSPKTAGSKKAAERDAAANLLQLLPSTKKVAPQGSKATTANPKNSLQEYCQKRGLPLPTYECMQNGPSHSPEFLATATVIAEGQAITTRSVSGKTRKEAEMLAAQELLQSIRA